MGVGRTWGLRRVRQAACLGAVLSSAPCRATRAGPPRSLWKTGTATFTSKPPPQAQPAQAPPPASTQLTERGSPSATLPTSGKACGTGVQLRSGWPFAGLSRTPQPSSDRTGSPRRHPPATHAGLTAPRHHAKSPGTHAAPSPMLRPGLCTALRSVAPRPAARLTRDRRRCGQP